MSTHEVIHERLTGANECDAINTTVHELLAELINEPLSNTLNLLKGEDGRELKRKRRSDFLCSSASTTELRKRNHDDLL